MKDNNSVSFLQMLGFFIPLGLSSSLVTISHVIINGTLTRAPNPEEVLASYAIAMSLLGITERPAILLRQTCSALVRDRISFRAVSRVAFYLLVCLLLLGLLVSYTPVGEFLFGTLFGSQNEQVTPIIHVYRILMFVSIFSGLRCLFQGIIIYNKRTFWLTIGMFFRLTAMYALSQYFISRGVDNGRVGAIIFLTGMIIEASVAIWEGIRLYRHQLPEKKPDHPYEKPAHILKFYRPLLYSSFIAVIIVPSINMFLGQTPDAARSIAAFALAASVCQLVLSFFSYLHQIVLNFYRVDPRQVKKFTLLMAFLPSVFLSILSFTPLGAWLMMNPLGARELLLEESLLALRLFVLLTLTFTWLDFCNGLLLLKGQTKVMIWSQALNVTVVLLTLIVCISFVPHLNSRIGVLAQSFGMIAELAVVVLVLRASKRHDKIPERSVIH